MVAIPEGYARVPRSGRFVWRVVLVNMAFVLFHPALRQLIPFDSDLYRSLAVNLAMFVLPSAGWIDLARLRSRRLGSLMIRLLAVSTAVFLSSVVILKALGIEPSAPALWNSLWLLTAAGLACSRMFGKQDVARPRVLARPELTLLVACSAAAYGLFFWGATQVVPPVEDQDLEVSGTGYSLLTRLEPVLLTDRHSVFFFAHPPLLHFFTAGSYALSGALPDLRFYFEASQRVRDAWEGRPPQIGGEVVELKGHPIELPVPPGEYRIMGAQGTDYLVKSASGEQTSLSVESVELDRVYAHYLQYPRLIESRSPNLFFAAMTVGLLAFWASRISHKWWMGLLAAAVYATSPEVLVRSSYGGYFAVGGLACILLLLTAEARWRAGGALWPALLAGAFAALVDHKLIVLPVALALGALVNWRRPVSVLRSIHPAMTGFIAGYALFWVWGLAIAPDAFVADHLHHHFVDRITHNNPFGYGGYPSAIDLWKEFNDHTGYLLMPLGIGLLIWELRRIRTVRSDLTRQRLDWLLWFGVTAVVFTIIDWRMTKHLAPLVLSLCLALLPAPRAARWRIAVPVAAFVLVLAVNAISLAGLVNDFDSYIVTPSW